jgi:ABC-type Zn uptake system ZnuABC Zn-binding protein ZnuA
VITVTDGVVPISSIKYANATDPHAWMSAANGLIYSQNIRDAFIELMPEKEQEFAANYESYRAKLEELDSYISNKLGQIPENRRILITSHDAFQYYGRRYRLRLEAVMGVSTEADVQTSDIRRLNKVISETGVPAVFMESTINPQVLKQIASDNGVVIGGELFADSLSDIEGPAGTYLKMLRHNTDVIFEGLTRELDLSRQPGDEGAGFNALWILLLAPIGMALIVFIIRIVRS